MFNILIHNTYFKFPCLPNGDMAGGKMNVDRFLWCLTESLWNPRIRKWQKRYVYCYYNRNTKMLHLPRYVLDRFLDYIKRIEFVTTYIPAYPGREISVKMKPNIEDKDNQVDLIEYLTDPKEHVKLLEASTGIGKTYCTIKSGLVKMGTVTMIQTSSLTEQWKNEVLKFTKLNERDIYILQGSKSIEKLLNNKTCKPKCFIASLRTLYNYAIARKHPYTMYPPLEEFLNTYGVGFRGVDEVHENFFANTMIDLNCNVETTVNLSATYSRSDRQSNKIFNLVYPEFLRYGAHHNSKYTKVFMYSYQLTHYMEKAKLIGQSGYMQCKFEGILCHHKSTQEVFLNDVLYPLVQAHYINYKQPGEKLLILCFTRNLVELIHKYLVAKYPNLKIITYMSEDDDSKHANCDIVVSTIKSSGTGRDIKNLITCINTTSFKSETLTKQCLGRLRYIPTRETVFIDMYNRHLHSHFDHKRIREKIYEDRALDYRELNIN